MSSEFKRFREMVESSQDVFWAFDENANFTYVSPRIRDLLGYEPEELIGLNAFDLMSAAEAERVHRHFDPIARRYLPFNNLENTNIHKDGHEVIIESSGTPIFSEDGQFRGYCGIDRDITSRKQTEVFLRESEERFRNMAQMLPEVVFELDIKGDVTFASTSFFELFGYTREDLLRGLNVFDLIAPEERGFAREGFRRRLSGQISGAVEYTALHKDGSTFPVILNTNPIVKGHETVGLIGVMTDNTERKFNEDSLRKSQELLNDTQSIAKLGSWQFDVAAQRVTWSEETYRIFGETPGTIVPSYEAYLDLVHPDDRAIVEQTYAKSLKQNSEFNEYEHRIVRKKTGDIRHIQCKYKHEYNQSGSRVRTIGMVQDITERKTSELALRLANKSAESANRAKSIFLAKVSHEIRTPLTAIIGFGELMEEAELTDEYRKYLASINSAGKTLSNLIDDILDLSKIEAGELVIRQIDFSLNKIIEEIVNLYKNTLKEKNLIFSVNIDPGISDFSVGDPLRIKQMILNLIDNAFKFTVNGEIKITVSVLEKTESMDLLEISVKDTGIGIPKDFIDRIFEPFFQVRMTGSQHREGSGLGLVISQSLAGMMGGSLRVDSEEGVGSTFSILLPLKRKVDRTDLRTTPVNEASMPESPELNVLLVEDNQINIQFIKAVLENKGHVVAVAENGLAALNILDSYDGFDLMLMDIEMPLIDGVDTLKIIREKEQASGKHLRVIALTAFALIGDKEKYLKVGFDGYVAKPFRTKDLLREIGRVVQT